MSEYDKVIDKYWIEFLSSEEGDYTTEKSRHSNFWFWFYNTLSGGVTSIAKQRWEEAQS